MRRKDRAARMVRIQWLLGLAATIAVLGMWSFGALELLEGATLDWRTRWFWRQSPGPSNRVVVVAVDDGSLKTVGRWPWNRSDLAAVIREMTRANAKVVALDLLLDEPQQKRLVEVEPDPFEPLDKAAGIETPSRGLVTDDGTRVTIGADDVSLANAIAEHGGVVIAGSFKFINEKDEAAGIDRESGTTRVPLWRVFEVADELGLDLAPPDAPSDHYQRVRDQLRDAILGPSWRAFKYGPEFIDLDLKTGQAITLARRARDSSIARPSGTGEEPWRFARTKSPSPPIALLSDAAARVATVSFDTFDPDARVRRIPLWIEHRGRLWPSLGLAAAVQYEGLSMGAPSGADGDGRPAVEIVGNDTVLRQGSDNAKVLHTFRSRQEQGVFDGIYYIPWPRGTIGRPAGLETVKDWQWQFYDLVGRPDPLDRRADGPAAPKAGAAGGPEGASTRPGRPSEISAGFVYEPAQLLTNLRANVRTLAKNAVAVPVPLGLMDAETTKAFRAGCEKMFEYDSDSAEFSAGLAAVKSAVAATNGATRRALVLDLCEDEDAFDQADAAEKDESAALRERLLTMPIPKALAEEPDEAKRAENLRRIEALRAWLRGAGTPVEQIDAGVRNIRDCRATLFERLNGRIVFFGFSAEGTLADFVATSVDPRTPGVMVHAAIANSILTNFQKAPWPFWADALTTVLAGLAGTWMGVRASVLVAPIAVAGVILGWFGIAGLVCWDASNTIVSVSGPTVSAATGWGVVLLHRLLVEQRGRRLTEDRFKSYVSPAVVDILVNDPSMTTMKPKMKVLTVMFTDVADFTTTSEKLGPELLEKCLKKYLKEMTEILQTNQGTLDKYLGDGIMCFWNDPVPNAFHARDACRTAVEMMRKLDELNGAGYFEEAGKLHVRAGLSTGDAMVGDFGNPPRNSNYTLLGDTVNFAARLEGANKFFGSRILASRRTREAVTDMKFRTLGKVVVKGKKEDEWLYELVGDLEPHGPATDEWLEMTEEAVNHYMGRRFDQCLSAFDVLTKRFGDKKLAALYRASIEAWRARPDIDDAFTGAIVLTEK